MLYVSIQRLPNRFNAHTGESVALFVWLAIFLYDIGHIPRLPGRQNTRQGSHTQTRPHSHLLAYSRMLLPCNTHCLLKWRCHRMGMVNICLRMALCHCRYSTQFQKNEYAQLLRDYMLRTYGINYLGSIQAILRLRWLECVGWVIAEGISYISGAVLYSIHKVRYMHTVFHILIILGDIFHMVAVWNILSIFGV